MALLNPPQSGQVPPREDHPKIHHCPEKRNHVQAEEGRERLLQDLPHHRHLHGPSAQSPSLPNQSLLVLPHLRSEQTTNGCATCTMAWHKQGRLPHITNQFPASGVEQYTEWAVWTDRAESRVKDVSRLWLAEHPSRMSVEDKRQATRYADTGLQWEWEWGVGCTTTCRTWASLSYSTKVLEVSLN